MQSPRQPNFKPGLTKQMYSCCDHPSWNMDDHFWSGFVVEHQLISTSRSPSIVDTLLPSSTRACSKNEALSRGTGICNGIQKSEFVEQCKSNDVVTMQGKGNEVQKPQALLSMHNSSSTIQWSALIASYMRKGQAHNALDCFKQMQKQGIPPDAVTCAGILKACAVIRALDAGKQIHDEISRQGLLEHNAVLGGALVDMYAKCGAFSQAHIVLEKLPFRNVVTWSALIAGYAQKGQGEQALECFEKMQHEGICPNAVTYVCILKSCAAIGAIDKGKQIHDEISRQGLLEHDIVVGGALVDMYSKCGALTQARSVLEKLPSRNVVSWSALITGYAQRGQGQQALECFGKMQHEGIYPDAVSYVCILKACAMIGSLDKGKQIHDQISEKGLLKHNKVLGNALVDMYAKCGALHKAQSVLEELRFRNVVSWNALITGYAQHGQGQQALDCFEKMLHEGIHPDPVTYLCILKVCAGIGAIGMGKKIHDEILRQGLLEHDLVLGNALVDMYAKYGALSQAQGILEKLPSRNIVSWSALIAGYAQKGQGQQALECFQQMQREGIPPDAVTYMCILKACALIGAIDKGKQIHEEILRQGLLEHDVLLGNALVEMYAKLGALPLAQRVLEKLSSRDIGSWSALIRGYAQNGQDQQALECYEQMQRERIPPDALTYLNILRACAVVGAIEKGKQIHDEISRRGLPEQTRRGLPEQTTVLGGALVDMYAKCGALRQALSVVENLPSSNIVSWSALIAGYAQKGEVEQALRYFEQMMDEGILPDTVTFLCLLNMCSHLGLVEKGQELFGKMGTKYGLKPDLECFTSMVNLLGRAGQLSKAVEVIKEMPFSANSAVWLCLFSACQRWTDFNVGIWAFEKEIELDKCDGAAYILMANTYAAAGMPERAKDIEVRMVYNKA